MSTTLTDIMLGRVTPTPQERRKIAQCARAVAAMPGPSEQALRQEARWELRGKRLRLSIGVVGHLAIGSPEFRRALDVAEFQACTAPAIEDLAEVPVTRSSVLDRDAHSVPPPRLVELEPVILRHGPTVVSREQQAA